MSDSGRNSQVSEPRSKVEKPKLLIQRITLAFSGRDEIWCWRYVQDYAYCSQLFVVRNSVSDTAKHVKMSKHTSAKAVDSGPSSNCSLTEAGKS